MYSSSNRRAFSLCAKHPAAFKNTARRRSALALSFGLSIAALSFLGSRSAQAAARVWTGNTTANWNAVDGFDALPVSGDSFTFNAAGTAGALLNNNLTAGFTIASITFSSTASAYTINGNAFTLSAGSGAIVNSSSNDQVFGTAITLGGTLDHALNGGTGRTLTFNGGITYGTTSNFNVTTTASTIVLNAAGTGSGTLATNGIFGLATANSTNTSFTFRTDFAGSTLQLGNNTALGTGAYYNQLDSTVRAGTSLTAATNGAVGNVFVIGNGILTLGGTNALELSGTSSVTGSGAAGSSGAIINTGGNRTLTVTNTAATTISGKVSLSDAAATSRTLTVNVASTAGTTTISGPIVDFVGANGSGTGGLPGAFTKTNTGSLTLSGTNTYTGATTISAGTIVLGSTSALGGSNSVSLTTTSASTSATVAANSPIVVGQLVTGTGIAANTTVTAYTASTGAVTLSTAATATGTNTDAFAGTTSITSGATLDLGGQTITEVIAPAGTGVGANGALINSSATAAVVNSDIVNGTSYTVGGTGDITLQRSRSGGSTFTLTKIGTGTLTLGNANGTTDNLLALDVESASTVNLGMTGSNIAVDRGLIINAGGTVKFTGNSTGMLGTNNAITVNNGTLNLNGVSSNVGSGVLKVGNGTTNGTISGGSASTFTSSGTYDMESGSVDVRLAGTGALGKTTSGMVTLSQANTYSGGTTVTLGALTLSTNGTLGTGNVTLANTTGVTLTLGSNTSAIADAATLTFGPNSAIAGNVTGSETLAAITDSSPTGNATLNTAGTYSASDLNTYFGVSSFSGVETYTIAPVPEPATVFGGLLMVGTLGWRGRRSLRGLLGRSG